MGSKDWVKRGRRVRKIMFYKAKVGSSLAGNGVQN
jgi:hypothetical protein